LPKVEKVGHSGAHFVSILQLGSKEVLILGGITMLLTFFGDGQINMAHSKTKKKQQKTKREM
jgi:hypothetical protein